MLPQVTGANETQPERAGRSPVEPPYLIPAIEAARRLRQHPATLRKHLSDGTIPGVRIGTRWFVNSEVLKDVLDGRYNTP